MSIAPWDLPPYIQNENQENYHAEFNQTLRDWFNNYGFYLPTLTNAQVTDLLAVVPPIQAFRQWFNSDLGKLQILVAPGTVETVTSV